MASDGPPKRGCDGLMRAVWCLTAALGISCLLTSALRRYALGRGLVDIPNARSSHHQPTPRAGGLAIVVTFLAGLPLLQHWGALSVHAVVALAGAAGGVALIGLWDDHGHVPARWRLLAHFAAAGWALAWLGGLPPLSMLGASLEPGRVGLGLGAIYLVWLVNSYNFMDGIDGIAVVQAMTVCLGGVLLCAPFGHEWLVPALLAAAAAGFLLWNFPVAQIFLGDVGSGFLGMTLGILSIQAAWLAPELLWSWIILMGVFVVDSTVTLLRRMHRRERLYEAHRSHAYQHAARKHGHVPVTLAVGAINLLWLMPVALLVGFKRLDGVAGVVVAYLPLTCAALRYGAGVQEVRDVDYP